MLRDTRAAVAETGVGVLDIEFVRITPGIDIMSIVRTMPPDRPVALEVPMTALTEAVALRVCQAARRLLPS